MVAPEKTLRISSGLELPLDVVTEAVGIIATRGAGKSYGSVTLIEEAIAADVQTVVLDPTGVYHGLRSSATGKSDGLPVYVLGGPHGDVPLEDRAGVFIADLVVDSGHSFVLDLSDFSKTKARTFVGEFLNRLYERKARNRTTTLLVVDEADEFAPQKARGETAAVLGAMETIVKRGRSRGIGCVLISQRTQAINKDVLDLIDTLIVMRIVAPRGRDVVREWIDAKEARDELGVIDSLSSLPTGEAFVWSPVRSMLVRFRFRRIRTFDSYQAPKPGEVRTEPARRRALDLDALGEQIRATVEKARENDPAELRRLLRERDARIHELERSAAAELEQLRAELANREPARVEVPVLTDADVKRIEGLAKWLDDARTDVVEALDATRGVFDAIAEKTRPAVPPRLQDDVRAQARAEVVTDGITPPRADRTARSRPEAAPERRATGGASISPAERRVLASLMWWLKVGRQTAPTREQIAVVAGYKHRSGGYRNLLGKLRSSGMIDYPETGRVVLLDAGMNEVDDPATPSTKAAMRSAIFEKLSPAQARVLGAVIDADRDVTRDELAQLVGYEPSSGGYRNLLGSLRTLGFIDYPQTGLVRASAVLFPEGR